MKILNTYVFKESAIYFAISLFAFTGILFTIQLLRLAGLIVNRGVEVGQIATIFIAVIPTFLEIALPLSVLLGVMLAFARLSGDSEVVVFRASGISLTKFLRPIALFGLLVSLLSLGTSLYLRPWGYSTLEAGLFNIAKSRGTAGLEQAVFNELGPITLYAQSIDHSTGKLEGVLIDDQRDGGTRRVIVAQRGTLTSENDARTITLLLEDGDIHEQVQKKYILTHFLTNSLVLRPDELFAGDGEKRERRTGELTNNEILATIEKFEALPQGSDDDEDAVDQMRTAAAEIVGAEDAASLSFKRITRRIKRLEIEFERRYSLPCAALILALLGMALGIQPSRAQRTWGAAISVGVGILVFVLYYVLLSLGIAFSEGGTFPTRLGVWAPNIVSALLTAVLLRKICLEQWQSVAQGLEPSALMFKRIASIFRRRVST